MEKEKGMGNKILVVDDSKSVRFLLANILNKNDLDIVEASDGEEGLLKAKEFKNDLLMAFIDVSMPKMDGLELLACLKKEGVEKLPVVILTTTQTMTKIKEAKALGANGWIVKPFKYADIVETVERLTGKVMKSAKEMAEN